MPRSNRVTMLVALFLLILATTLGSGTAFRLPLDVAPKLYQVKVITDLGSNGSYNFRGQVWIHVECRVATQNITLHSKELSIPENEVYVTLEGDSNNLLASLSYDQEVDFLVLMLNQPLQQGQRYLIYIPFQGTLTEGLAGFYRSSYMDRTTGEIRWMAVTQFESTDARRAFPCFDEPSFKAVFTISLGHHKKFKSVSNMPLNRTEPIEGSPDWQWNHFNPTRRMSTYLVAFLVSDLEFKVSPTTYSQVTFRIWARYDALPQTEYAGVVGPRVLDFFEKFFDVKYPLPKQDMAAIPDFSAGAMENWGLITYRETALLYDPNVTSTISKKYLTNTIAHELAHQWFGNLVTMKWWSDLWLNEGFATFVATLGVNEILPEWKVLEGDAVENFLTVAKLDSLKTSHPVYVPIDMQSKITEIFDPISYKKGSYLLRMMSLFLGHEVFRKGVSQYLKKHEYCNAAKDDLWQSLTEAAHQENALSPDMTVKMVMDTWTVQTGYPLLTITRDYEKGTASITQERYLSFINEGTGSEEKPCWIVPLTYATQSQLNFEDTRPIAWMFCNNPTTVISGLPGQDQWVIFNNMITGLFRVNYDEGNWQLISNALNTDYFTNIHILNRVQLIDDAMNLAWVGKLRYSTTLSIMNYLQRESEYLPWKTALTNLRKLKTLLQRTPDFQYFINYVGKLMTYIYQKTGPIAQMDDSDVNKARLNALVLTWACKLQMGDCVQQAINLFQAWMRTNNPQLENPIPRDGRAVVYCIALKHGSEQEWNFVWEQYKLSNVGTEKKTLLGSLGCAQDTRLLNRFLQWSISETSGIRKQDSSLVFSSVANSEFGFEVARDFFFQQLPEIHRYFVPRIDRLGSYISSLAEQMFTLQEYQQMDNLLKQNTAFFKKARLASSQALETIQVNMQWYQNYYNSLLASIQG